MNNEKNITTDFELNDELQNLALIQDDFLIYAVQDNKELADVLIKPVLNRLGIKNYKIISVDSEVTYSNLKRHEVRIDCLIELEDGTRFLVEVQNGHPERMPLKRIRYQHSIYDSHFLKEGEDYNKLPQIISIIYATEPLENYDNGRPVADFVFYDLIDNKVAADYGIRVFYINGKYKEEGFEEFSDIIRDLQETKIEDIKNPVIKDIHKKIKGEKKGGQMYSDYVNKKYGKYIQKCEELEQELQNVREESAYLKKILIENGISFNPDHLKKE